MNQVLAIKMKTRTCPSFYDKNLRETPPVDLVFFFVFFILKSSKNGPASGNESIGRRSWDQADEHVTN